MRNFITIRNEKERKIFLDYCEKHDVKLLNKARPFRNGRTFFPFQKTGFQIFFGERFDYLTYSTGTTYAQKHSGYNEIKFNEVFKVSNTLELE